MASVNVIKRGSNWQYRFEGAKVDGKRKQYSKSGFRTKKEALEAGTKALAEYNQGGTHFEPSSVSVSDYFKYWLDNGASATHKETTVRTYRGVVKRHIDPRLGQYRLSALTPSILSDIVNQMKINGYSKSTITVVKAVISSALDYAVEPLRYIKDNPMRYVKTPKIDKKERQRTVLTEDQWKQIIERFPFGNRFYVPLMIGYFCGTRISEVTALLWEDIDLEECTMDISKQLISVDKKWKFSLPKQTSARKIKFGETLKQMFIEEKERQEKNEAEYGEHYWKIYLRDGCLIKSQEELPFERLHPVCVDSNGNMTKFSSFPYLTRVVQNDMGIDFDYHTLRHTHGTMLFENGANIKAIQTRLGHKDINTTLQTYTHTTSNMEDNAVKIFEKLVHK